jgi:hypothetical protein
MKTWACWLVAVVVTLGSAVWQRMSGPTYPARGTVSLGGAAVHLRLPRTQISGRELDVVIPVADPDVHGAVVWRRFPTTELWQTLPMRREGNTLVAALPTQPTAGKLEYQVRLVKNNQEATFPERPAVARFRHEVPPWVLAPHILAMFLGMLFATRAGVEAVVGRNRVRQHTFWALGLLMVGGFALGPAVQKLAFDAWWTGVPFGWDLTDNKTLIAVAAWVIAALLLRGGLRERVAVVVAAVVTLVVFAVPHSVWGSQLDWQKVQQTQPRPPG